MRAGETPATLATTVPSGAIGFVEVQDLGSLLARIQHSDYLAEALSSAEFRELEQSPQYRMAMAGRTILETQLGMDLWTAGEKVFGGKLAAAFYRREARKQPDVLVLLRLEDTAAFGQLQDRIEPFLVLAEAQHGQLDRSLAIDGTRLANFRDRAFAAVHEQTVLASNSRELLERSLALLKGTESQSLVDDDAYRNMSAKMGAAHLLRVFVNAQLLAKAAGGRAIPKKVDNPLASLLFGGMLELAAATPYAGLTFDVHEHEFALTAQIAADVSQVDESHRSFFSDPAGPGTPSIPAVPGLQGGFTFHRNFADWYRHREVLLEEQALPGFDKFESGLANLLPGKDFGSDILPLIGSNLTFVSAVQTYPHLDGRPAVELPGFAIVVDLAQPDEAADVFRLFFQTLSSILNLQAGQEGREPMVMDSETYHGVQVTYGRFLKKPQGEQLPLLFNFVPSAAHVGEKYVISSSHELCRQLIDALQNPADDSGRANRNLNLEIHPAAIAESVKANRDVFEARAVREGKPLERAQGEVDLLLRILRKLELVRLSTTVNPDSFQVQFEGSWK